jgi:hypothetical protein
MSGDRRAAPHAPAKFAVSQGSPTPRQLSEAAATPLLHPDGHYVAFDASGGTGGAGAGGAAGWLAKMRARVSWSTVGWVSGNIFGTVMQNIYLQETGAAMPQYAYFIFVRRCRCRPARNPSPPPP